MNAKDKDAGAAHKAEHEARKIEILTWMRANKLKRDDLAEKLGSSKGTLDNWFSKGFPEWALKAIGRLKNPTGDMSAGLEVTFTASEFAEILEAMEIVGCSSLKTFYEEAIRNHVGLLWKPIGPCEPYAAVCRHCTDCSMCKHCSQLGGKCSVCFKK